MIENNETNTEVENNLPSHEVLEGESEINEESAEHTEEKARDRKPKSPFEHWLKRQFAGFLLDPMNFAIEEMEKGVPVPYLAFYCCDQVGNLKSADLYKLAEAKQEWLEIQKKQTYILKEVESQGKLTPEFKQQLDRSTDLDRLEDLYAPFKLKKQTLGVQAKEAGLSPLADYLWKKGHGEEVEEIAGTTLEEKAAAFAKADSKFPTAEAVIKGVQDILIEKISENFELRSLVRSTVFRRSKIKAGKGPKAKPNSKYAKFFDYQEPIGSLKKTNASHRYLALRKGWMEDELIVAFERPDEGILLEKFEEFSCPQKESIGASVLAQAARLALKGNVYTVMENEAHRHLKEEAERHVIDVLTENLRKKILRPGVGRKAVMGIDPGSANHPCSLALLDQDGKLLLHMPFKLEEVNDPGKQEFLQSLENLKIEAIAVAHGPRSKEVREGFKKILAEAGRQIPILAVHEHTSSIYSASPAGKEEFPQLDVNSRRAIFVARFLQDPMGMIVKLDPKFLSLGEFQHEVHQGKLKTHLQRAMEGCVNFVGVDPNYAPAHVLSHVAGLNSDLAQAIVAHRKEHKFEIREDLKKVPGLATHFEYCAGFLRLVGPEKLDNAFIHPKQYEWIKSLAQELDANDIFVLNEEQKSKLTTTSSWEKLPGQRSRDNLLYELDHWGEDPRGVFQAFEYNPSIKTMEDLKPGVSYPGMVTNVTSFGAFVDIGIDQDGLVHISELTDAQAKNPFDLLFPGDQVWVFVSNVNAEKKQISLTMKGSQRGKSNRGRRDNSARRPRSQPREQRPHLASGESPPQEGSRPEYRGPRRDNRDNRGGPGGPGGERRDRREFRGKGPEGTGGGPRKDGPERPKRAPRKPQRDPITGAVVKFEEEEGRGRGGPGPRLASKAKPHTFNPFANLADILKKQQD